MDKTYLNGIYQAKQTELININDIKDLTKENLIKYLENINYGTGTHYNNLSNILSFELRNVRRELISLSNSNLISDIFFYKEDLLNIKIAYKSVYYNVDVENYSEISRYSIEGLIEFFKNNNDSFINSEDLELFLKFKELKGKTLKSRLEEIEIIYTNYIYDLVDKNMPSIKDYILTNNFNNNLLVFLKLKLREDDKEFLKQLLIDQIEFDKSYWYELFELSNEQVLDKLSSVYFGKLNEGLNHFFLTKELNILEKSLNEVLTDKVEELSYDIDSLGPVFNYLHLKMNEIKNIRQVYYLNE